MIHLVNYISELYMYCMYMYCTVIIQKDTQPIKGMIDDREGQQGGETIMGWVVRLLKCNKFEF